MTEPPDLLSQALDHLQLSHRREQDALAELLRTGGERVAVQAGTGVGKSLAALTYAASVGRPGRPAVVVTMTNALTHQYAVKDAPDVAKAIGMTYTRVMGRSHYLCASGKAATAALGSVPGQVALTEADCGPDFDPNTLLECDGEEEREEAIFVAAREWWLRQQVAANPRATYATEWERNPDVHPREAACPGADDCQRKYGGCGARKARGRGGAVSVVITNAHVLLYHRLIPMAGLLPEEIAYVLVDEAHQFPETISSILSIAIGPKFGRATRGDWDEEEGLRVKRQVEYPDGTELPPGITREPTAAEMDLNIVVASPRDVLNALAERVSTVRRAIADRIDWTQERASEVRVRPTPIQADALRAAVIEYGRWANALTTGTLGPPPARSEVQESGEDSEAEAPSTFEMIELLAMTAGIDSVVASVARDDPQTIRIVRTKVSRLCAQTLGPRAALISGTLPPSLPARVGWPDVTAHDVGHPFDYRASVRGWISCHSGVKSCPPRLTGATRKAWLARLEQTYAARADEVDRFIGQGRGLVLVPSHGDSDVLSRHLVPRLVARGVPVFMQPREGGSPAAQEQARLFREQYEQAGGPAVLIGTQSLTTGVDLPGDLLTRVVWWCLPIGATSPADAQRDLFYPGYLLERRRMTVAQGVGRLMRRTTDSGWVLLCDDRFAQHLAGANGILDRHLREIVWKRLPIRQVEGAA